MIRINGVLVTEQQFQILLCALEQQAVQEFENGEPVENTMMLLRLFESIGASQGLGS